MGKKYIQVDEFVEKLDILITSAANASLREALKEWGKTIAVKRSQGCMTCSMKLVKTSENAQAKIMYADFASTTQIMENMETQMNVRVLRLTNAFA